MCRIQIRRPDEYAGRHRLDTLAIRRSRLPVLVSRFVFLVRVLVLCYENSFSVIHEDRLV